MIDCSGWSSNKQRMSVRARQVPSACLSSSYSVSQRMYSNTACGSGCFGLDPGVEIRSYPDRGLKI